MVTTIFINILRLSVSIFLGGMVGAVAAMVSVVVVGLFGAPKDFVSDLSRAVFLCVTGVAATFLFFSEAMRPEE
ncbi:MAG: hypothetical protein WCE53_08180 [Candidatus Acidiferrum sp.]